MVRAPVSSSGREQLNAQQVSVTGHPAERAALLAAKAELFARIADQHIHTDPAHADQAR